MSDIPSNEEPSLDNVVEQKGLRWIFVGGKGGVGKTTCSCSLGIILAQVRESVLILSTDPAHNVSDAFNQKFTKRPTLVRGFSNLYAMEVDPSSGLESLSDDLEDSDDGFLALSRKVVKDLLVSFPGVDESMSFAEVMKLVNGMNFSVVIFDTAPTGHTLRLLSLPSIMMKGLERILRIKNQFSGLTSQMSALLGVADWNADLFSTKLDEALSIIKEVHSQFTNPLLTTFICVCIPEFLSLFETERLIQELSRLQFDVHNIVVNQILPDVDAVDSKGNQCAHCSKRRALHRKYLSQIHDLYSDFNVTLVEAQGSEVRGIDNIKSFSKMLTKQCPKDNQQ